MPDDSPNLTKLLLVGAGAITIGWGALAAQESLNISAATASVAGFGSTEDARQALERAQAVNCLYHVLGGTLSPLDGIGPDDLTINELINRVAEPLVSYHGDGEAPKKREIILAVNATVEGQTTAHYITDRLDGMNVKVTRLAHGVPVGGELDYLDEGTLSAAIKSRSDF